MVRCVHATTPTHLLCHTMNVERRTNTVGAAGGVSVTYAAHLTGIACRFQDIDSSENQRYGRESNRRLVRVFTAGTRDIKEDDRLVYDSRYFDVIGRKKPQSEDVLLVLTAEETLPG